MHNEKVIFILPNQSRVEDTTPASFKEQLHECMLAIEPALAVYQLGKGDVLKQTIFFYENDCDDFFARKEELKKKLKDFYKTNYPPTSFIGQPPASGALLAIELVVMNCHRQEVKISRKESNRIPYITIETSVGKSIYAAGITAAEITTGISNQSQEAFQNMKEILDKEGMDFSHIVRQWNYIENITQIVALENERHQNYQIFNDTRSLYYNQSDFRNGYPAATGIGMSCGGVVLEFIATDLSGHQMVIPLVNPDQQNAHGYSQEVLVGGTNVGMKQKTTPKFERAKAVAVEDGYHIYVSGTASIRGQQTVHISNVEKQTQVTCENIAQLISPKNLKAHKLSITPADFSFTHIRIYIKDAKDLDKVKIICDKYFKDVPALYLVSDVCRENLLVEIEGGGYLR